MIDVLYIAGSGRSGSTLIERILGQINGVVSVGELRHLWRRNPERELCGCGRLLAECPFWTQVLAAVDIVPTAAAFASLHEQQQRVDRMRHIPAMLGPLGRTGDYAPAAEQYTEHLTRLYESILTIGDGQIVVDSSKDVSTLYLLSTMDHIRLRVVHLIRDSRAVAFSWMRQRVRPHVVDHVSYMPVYSPRKSAMDWNYRNYLSSIARSRTHDFLELRYEDFVAEPHAHLSRLAQFAGLNAVNLDFIQDNEIQLLRDSHTVSGNPMRFEKGTMKLKLDKAWQEQLADSDRRIVTSLTWPLLRKYGYA